MAISWNLNTATSSSSSRSAPPHHPTRPPRFLPTRIPWPGARRTASIGLRPPRSASSSGSRNTTGIPLQRGVRSLLRPSAVRYSSPIQEKSSKDVVRGDDDDDVSSLGGGDNDDGGSGRGGAGEGNGARSSGGDRGDDPSMELQVRPLQKRSKPEKAIVPEGLVASALEIINNVFAGNAVATVLASLQKNPTIRFLLQLMVAPFSEGPVLWGVFITVVNNQVGDESSYSSDNDIDETASARNNHNAYLMEMVQVNVNHLERTIVRDQNDTSTAPLVSTTPINSPEVNKGLLGFIYTLVWILLTLYAALYTFSVTYPGSANALVRFDEAWTKVICFINLMPCFGSAIMLPFASSLKEGEATNEHAGFDIFIWALYLLLLPLIPEYFLTLHVYLHIPKWAVWSFGTAIFLLKMFFTVRYIEGQRPTLVRIYKKYWKKN